MVIFSSNLLGDSLSALPAVWEKSKFEKIYICGHHSKEVFTLLPKSDNIEIINDIPQLFKIQDFDRKKFTVISAGINMGTYCGSKHMVQGYYPQLDLPIPTEITTSPIEASTEEVRSYDYLIAPNSRSNHNNNKLWPYDRWQQIIDWMILEGKRVAVLSANIPEDPIFANVDCLRGLPLNVVAKYINSVKEAVVSIDNGISHLTRILNAPHILCPYPSILPTSWVGNFNSNCRMIQIDPMSLTVQQMKDVISNYKVSE